MSDTYSVVSGRGDDPNLPPINLPSMGAQDRPRLRITVGKAPEQKPPAPGPEAPPWADYPKIQAAPEGQPQAPQTKPWSDYPKVGDVETPPDREVGTGEALARGAAHGLTFGATPALQGLSEASGELGKKVMDTEAASYGQEPDMGAGAGGAALAQPFIGAARLLHNYFSSHKDPEVVDAYNRGREEGLKNEKLAKEQHPAAFFGGVLAGSALTPAFSSFRAAGLGGRLIQGARGGGISGGLYGAGTETSEGGSPADVAKSAMTGAVTGAAIGAPVAGAVGPRIAQAPGRGARAAETARDVLHENLPVGAASDSRGTQHVTGAMTSLPVVGPRINERLERVEEAAGRHVEGISGRSHGTPTEGRATTSTLMAPGLRQAGEAGRAAIDQLYDRMRGLIDQNARFTMPRTEAQLNRIEGVRAGAHWENPGEGLEQFRRAATLGTDVNSVHRIRSDARDAGNVLRAHPGYNAGDYNAITRAITQDMREMVAAAAIDQTPRGRAAAVRAFDQAETEFGRLAPLNERVREIAEGREGGIGSLIKAAQGKGGDVQLLQHLRDMMPQREFEELGSQILSELGYSGARDQFSIAQFALNWGKISPEARRILFPQQQERELSRIAELGNQIKRVLGKASSSHSSNWLAIVDILKDVAILAGDVGAHGAVSEASGWAAASSGLVYGIGWLLGNPARASSLRAFMDAYGAITRNPPTPGRIAAFNLATRNMANTMNVPVQDILRSIGSHTRADEDQPQNETVQGKTQAPKK